MRVKKIIAVVVCILAGHVGSVRAQQTFSIDDSVAYALKNSPVLQGLEISIQQADEDIRSARGYFLPSISTGMSYKHIYSIDSTGPTDSDYVDQNKAVASIQLTQSLFSGFETVTRYERAKLVRAYQEARLDVERLGLVFDVRSTFLELLKARYDSSIISRKITRLESDLSAARAFSNKKLVPYSQVLQAEADLELAGQRLWETRTAVFRHVERLNLLLGVAFDQNAVNPIDYAGQFDQEHIEFSMDVRQCVDLAMKNRVEPRLIDLEIEMAQKDEKMSKGKYYPRVNFTAGMYDTDTAYDEPGQLSNGQTYDRDQNNFYWDAGVYVKWDFFDGGTSYYRAKKERLQIKRLETDLRRVSLEISENVIVAHKLFYETEKRLDSIRKAIAAAEENYAREQKRFKAKLTTISHVLAAETKLFESEAILSQALLDYKLSMVRLRHAMGISREQ